MAKDKCNGLHLDYYIRHIVLNYNTFSRLIFTVQKYSIYAKNSVIQQVNTTISLWCSANIYIQYTYIVGELFMPVSQRVQMNFIFNDNVRILCLSCNVKKVGKLVRFKQKEQKPRHSSPFINVVKGVFFVVRVTLVPV
jgi:hypothetical protein